MRWFVRSDVDGFFGLALDNLVQLLLIDALCRFVLGFDSALIYGHILPGTAVAVLVGNLYYAREAMRLGQREQRSDVCALPYGINTVSIFGFVFLVMLPAKLAAGSAPDAARIAFRAGLVACFGSGLIELLGAFVAERLRRVTPRAALLSTLAGIALGFISLGFLLRTFARPVVGLSTLAIVMLTYFGRVRFRGGLPSGLIAVLLGTLLSWLTGIAPGGATPGPAMLNLPVPMVGELLAALTGPDALTYFSVIVPMGLFNLLGSLQNIESAEAAGDRYQTRPALAVNGLGTLVGSLFGSCFPTTIYIGHPGWKAMGARAGYSVLNGAFIVLICITGTVAHIAWLVPIDAGMAIVLWIGVVITAQAFHATPSAHAPAVVMGLLPGVAAWGSLLAKAGLRAAGAGSPGGPAFDQDLIARFLQADVWIDGAFALEQGFVFSSLLLAAITVAVIERAFFRAATWCAVAAALSALGLIHAYAFTLGDTRLVLEPAWPFVIGYAAMATLFALARWLTVPDDSGATGH
jgi:AGZA family xanthine/uracil permease-like MFS transporter